VVGDVAKIVQLPGAGASAKTVLNEALEAVTDSSVVFVILIDGDDIWTVSSKFKVRDLCWAAKTLDVDANRYCGEKP
jgi:hypothetical protein